MGTTFLRQFLQSLCHNSPWNYAVFWKLQHQNQMLLTWEDGYSDCPKPTESTDGIPGRICFKKLDKRLYTSCQSSILEKCSVEYPVGPTNTYMANVHYVFGERLVGEVAYSGKHSWLFADDLFAAEVNSTEFPDEWLFQFAAGVKTILLVPVVPHGVVQLGSLEMVAEDLSLVAYINDTFIKNRNFVEYSVPSMLSREFSTQQSTLKSFFMENFDEPVGITMEELNPEGTYVPSAITMNDINYEDSKAFDCNKPINYRFSPSNQRTPLCIFQDAYHISGKDMPVILDGVGENDFGVQSRGLSEASKTVNKTLDAYNFWGTESSLLRVSGHEEDLMTVSLSNNHDLQVFGEHGLEVFNSFPDGGMIEQPLGDKNLDTSHEAVSSFFSIPTDCELDQAIGPVFLRQTKDSGVSGEDGCNNSHLIGNEWLFCGMDPSAQESPEDDPLNLLEAILTHARSSSDGISLNGVHVGMLSVSSDQVATSSKTHTQPEGSSHQVSDDTALRTHATSAFVARARNTISDFSSPDSSFQSMMSTLTKEDEQKKGYTYQQTRMASKLSNGSKRRGKTGDNRKPRPRDRQLIQDRVKELRELVPSGAKCSIDGLLDQTIKHMLFLRSVTDQVDKLRKHIHLEESDPMNMKACETMEGEQNGTSRAFELGSGIQVCPIVVNDLELPGEMLIEMLCAENGLFLEIAEVICRYKLTILKGTLECLTTESWARFLVKAPRGFHRLDIFWPLMQLLQQNRRPITSISSWI